MAALDRKTGKEIWKTDWQDSMKVPFFAAKNGSWMRSTPAWDGEKLYIGGMRDTFFALDGKTGDIVWQHDFVKEYNVNMPNFGLVCSPIIHGDYVFVQAGPGFLKMQRSDGKVIWRTLEDKGGMYGGAFSSPVLEKLHDKNMFLVQTRQDIAGIDPDDGSILFQKTVPNFRGMNILTPTVYKNSIFTSSYRNKSFLYDVSLSEEKFGIKQSWRSSAVGYMSSPIIIDGHSYLHLQNKRMACIDLSTGKEKWRSKEKFGEYASFVAQGSKILILGCYGELFLIDANPEEFKLLGNMTISDQQTWGHLAVVGDEIFVRELTGLAVYKWQ